jgi:hypothetical protein
MWSVFFVIPNLSLHQPVGNNYIAILPEDDPVVRQICSSSETTKILVEGFEDQFGTKAHPSILVVDSTAPDSIRDVEAIVGYRNAFALSTIIKGYEHRMVSTFTAFPLYSDYFDLYPITISGTGDAFITSSPSVLGYSDQTHKFRGQTSPNLAGSENLLASADACLFELLEKAWIRRFAKARTGEWSTRALFRSLEMAYQASSLPVRNHSTTYDYGTNASLWVSAFEILSHPRSGKANLLSVLELLGRYEWASKSVRRRLYRIPYAGTPHRCSLAQRLYKDLYDARNAFLHGNPVQPKQLHPFRDKRAPVITAFAPLVYKIALLSFLNQFRSQRKKKRMDRLLEYTGKLITERPLAEAIMKSRQ